MKLGDQGFGRMHVFFAGACEGGVTCLKMAPADGGTTGGHGPRHHGAYRRG